MATPCDLFLDTLANQRRERPRATARVPTPPPNRPRPYHERGGQAVRVVMVGAGEERKWGGDPCGRPRTSKVSGKETARVAMSHFAPHASQPSSKRWQPLVFCCIILEQIF